MNRLDIIDKLYFMLFEGELERVDKILRNIIKERESDFRVWLLLSMVKLRLHEAEKALNAVNKALELNENSMEAWFLKSKILNVLGEYQEALDAINKAIEISMMQDDYEDPELLTEKASILVNLNRRNEAKGLIEKVLDVNPYDPDALELKKILEDVE